MQSRRLDPSLFRQTVAWRDEYLRSCITILLHVRSSSYLSLGYT